MSWNRPSWKWSSTPAPPTHPVRPSTTTTLRWSMCPSWSRFQRFSPSAPRGPASRAGLRRAHDADLDAPVEQAVVERSAGTVGVRPLPVDDHAHADSVGGLREQRRRERLADLAGPEAELVDVDRARRRRDVVEHGRVEVPPLDVDARRDRSRLLEGEGQGRPRNRRPEEARCVATDVGVCDRYRRGRPHGAARYALRRWPSAARRGSGPSAGADDCLDAFSP